MSQKPTSEIVLPLMESFYTLQGEGAYTGSAAYFLRLGGCDVGCVWCDVKESWDAAAHPKVSIAQMSEDAKTSGTELVVVTGGEPTLHNLDDLTKALHAEGLKTNIETAGTNELSGTWNWVCFSPKKFKKPLDSIYKKANELKVVVFNKHDFQWAEEHAAKVGTECALFLQPEWDKREEITPMILNYVRENPKWRISIQTHKFLGIP